MLSYEGARYLREWAEIMPIAIQNIIVATEKVISAYQSVSEEVGPHREDFYQMLINLKKAQETSVEALTVLPIKLRETAYKIEKYCDSSADDTAPSEKKLILHR